MTQDEMNQLRNFKYSCDDNNIRIKELVVESLINNPLIIHCLDNKELDENYPEEYVGINIRKSTIFPDVQDVPKNYIGVAVNHTQLNRNNELLKINNVTIYIFCDERNLMDKDTGISRHDLLAALIKREFSYTNKFGLKATVTTDTEAITDTHYMTRTLTFSMSAPNNITVNNRVSDNYIGSAVK